MGHTTHKSKMGTPANVVMQQPAVGTGHPRVKIPGYGPDPQL